MDLYFCRHGEAEPAGATQTDAERQLVEAGRDDTRLVADALARAGLTFSHLFSSPLIRARQTAEIVAGVFGVSVEATERLRPGSRLGEVADLLAGQTGEGFFLVGHEPDFGDLVSQLVGGGHVRMATSAVAYVHIDRVEPGRGRLMWLVTPEVFAAAG